MTEICVRCKREGEDRRTLYMSCGYEMMELDIPFEKEIIRIHDDYPNECHFYTLNICKECRSEWLSIIRLWWEAVPKRESCGSGIFIRIFGGTFEVTENEFKARYPGREPLRVKNG